MDMNRRAALTTLIGAGLATACSKPSAPAAPGTIPRTEHTPSAHDPRFPPLPSTLLLNRQRAHQIMTETGIEALICAQPKNIYYLTNHMPQLVKMGMRDLSYAILPRDPALAPILVIGQFAYYLGVTERATADLVDARLYTSPAEEASIFAQKSLLEQLETPGYPGFLPTTHDAHTLHPVEDQRLAVTNRIQTEMAATSEAALVKSVRDLGLAGKKIAVDDQALAVILEQSELPIVARDGEHLIRRIRLQKSDAEITLARYAARANAEASLAAAKTVRDGATFQDMRLEYAKACAERMLTPSFMVIDGVIPDTAPGKIEEGRAFLIDCVSEHQGYHGDYGRTVCVGEPTSEIARATDAMAKVWDTLLPQLKPGMRYSQISSLATEAFAKQNSDAALICNPHSVGLNHTDEPGRAGAEHWIKDDLELVEGMVLSVDLPMIDLGLGGSAHLEDLVLIRKDGAELLNDAGDRVIIV